MITDEMVEHAWAAIVGRDIAADCYQASIIRADLRVALDAVDQYRAEEKRKNCKHVRAIGSAGTGNTPMRWQCPDCAANTPAAGKSEA